MTKIYIIGSVGSGKTTLAKRLSKELNIPYYELDLVTWEYNPKGNDRRRAVEEVEPLFLDIINKNDWIIENVGKSFYDKGFEYADKIIYLGLSKRALYWRIFLRWIKQNLKIEPASSKSTLKMLKQMIIWANKEIKDSKLNRLQDYKNKIVILNEKNINNYKYK